MEEQAYATAAYNFVPLPDEMLHAEIKPAATDEERKANYIAHVQPKGTNENDERLTGDLDIELKAETPLFIGIGNSEKFFSPTGAPRIPGSTLRGMTKNLVKILTCGAMRGNKDDADFNDKTLYFRSMAVKRSLPELKPFGMAYTDEISAVGKDGKLHSKAEAGFLIQTDDGAWWMVPTNFSTVLDESVGKRAAAVIWDDPAGGVRCDSGPMNSKTHYTIHEIPDFSAPMRISVAPEVVESYQADTTRRGVDLFNLPENWINKGKQKSSYTTAARALQGDDAKAFTQQDDIQYVMPCFYIAKNGTICHFGFQRNYRIPYPYSIGNTHIPEKLQSDDIDFADAIFGRKELWSGRVAFEDATVKPGTEISFEPAAFSKTLGSPKPTSFQLYLEQKNPKRLALWSDKNAKIRGYKLYWHQPKQSWESEDHKTEADNMSKHKIEPIKAGAVFTGRIRFERLSRVELGALLSVFALEKENPRLRYKIGQGKCIGLGSISIRMEHLRLIDAEKNTTLFTADGQWEHGEQEASPEIYTRAFEKYRDDHLSAKGRAAYAALRQELIALMDYDFAKQHPEWSTKDVRMMDIEKDKKTFTTHRPLPTATEVRQRAEERKPQKN